MQGTRVGADDAEMTKTQVPLMKSQADQNTAQTSHVVQHTLGQIYIQNITSLPQGVDC